MPPRTNASCAWRSPKRKKASATPAPIPPSARCSSTGGRVVARGHHRDAGQPHAEVACLQSAKSRSRKATVLFVTLEPCSTTGRTPPCTEAIIAAGIREVVVGAIDVNPRHAGRGLELLRAAGVKVRVGVLEQECIALNEAFNHWIQTKRPFVIAKCGMSLDGKLTRPPGEPPWITSAAAREHANRLRSKVDAILVGAETVRQDNPRLTVRAVDREATTVARRPHPLRGSCRNARIFSRIDSRSARWFFAIEN